MNFSLVVGTANPVYINMFLRSLAKYTTLPVEVFVVLDNQESDVPFVEMTQDVRDAAKNLSIKWEALGKGYHGVGHAWNYGIDRTSGDWVGIMNDDIFFTEKWLEQLTAFIETSVNLGVASPSWHWRGVPNIEGLPPEHAWVLCEPWLEEYSKHAVSYGDVHKNDADYGIQGCFFFLNRHTLNVMAAREKGIENHPGRFDETSFFANWEDTDMCMRMNRIGYDMRVTHSTALHHFGSQTVARSDVKAQTGDFYHKGIPVFYRKWGIQEHLGKQFMVHNSILTVDGHQYPSERI